MPDEMMDLARIDDPRAALLCARLYLRSGKRRLQQGSSAKCMAALYDAVLFGMRYYVAKHKGCASFVSNIDLWDATSLFQALARAGLFEDPLTLNRFSLMVERALWQESFSLDIHAMLTEAEKILARLGVTPFDNSARSDE